jgi:hypothetical protein
MNQVEGQSWCMQNCGRHVIVEGDSKVFCFDAGVLLCLDVFSTRDCLDVF